ncbi:uncharacterized protein F5Z01DRAFT_631451, partial [Emericellopsis atlantica]
FDHEQPSLEDFITHVMRESRTDFWVLMSTLVYMSRLIESHVPTECPMPMTQHQLFLAALIVAAKTLDDGACQNGRWCRVSLMSVGNSWFWLPQEEVNSAERQLIRLLEWHLLIREDHISFELRNFQEKYRESPRHTRGLSP